MKKSPRLLKGSLILVALLAILGLFLLRFLGGQESPFKDTPADRIPPRGNVILVVCDTLRADHLGLYGYPRPTSPFLDSLAERAWVYENAYSHYSYTWPTISNLFTGLPYSQIVREGLFAKPSKGFDSGGLTPRASTLAERLAKAGTISSGVSANPYVNAKLGFGDGFEDLHDIYHWNLNFWNQAIHKYTAEEVNEVAFQKLAKLEALGGPWFLYLHYFDPHMPYKAPAEDRLLFEDPAYSRTGRVVEGYFRDPKGDYLSYLTEDLEDWMNPADLAHLIAQYDAEIRHFDRGMQALFDHLASRGLLESTTVIITADHGEAFMERRFWGHGFLSRSEEEHVPLLVIPPTSTRGFRPARIRGAATTTDLHYSLLRHFGALSSKEESTPWWAVDLLSGKRRHKVVYTEGARDAIILRSPGHSYYVYSGLAAAKLPVPVLDGEYLFDLQRDPAETRNLFDEAPEQAAAFRERLQRELGLTSETLPKAWGDPLHEGDEEVKKRLRALGYLQ